MVRNQIRGGAVIAAAVLLAVLASPSSVRMNLTPEHGTFLTLKDRLDWSFTEIAKVTCRLDGPCAPPKAEQNPTPMSGLRGTVTK